MVRIYIHGRPQGQDYWSNNPAPNDKFYLNPFLDSKIGAEQNALMQVDIWQQNAYYSYIHRKNVSEKGNRPSAYFAITVCFEHQLCTKTETLYQLLELVYKQLCVGNLIGIVQDQERFLVAQFKDNEPILKQITSVITQNIDKYFSGSLIEIEQKQDSNSASIKQYALSDVDSPQFVADCLAYRTLIAPSFPSKDKLPIELRQQIAALEAQKASVIQERNDWENKAEQEAERIAKLNQQLQALEQQICQLEKQVSTIKDDTRREFQQQIRQMQDDLRNQQRDLQQAKQNLQQARNEKESLQRQLNELQKENERLRKKSHPQPNPNLTPTPDFDNRIKVISVEQLKDSFRRMAGRFPFLWLRIAAALALSANILIIVFGILILGSKKTHNGDILNTDSGEQVVDTTVTATQNDTTNINTTNT